MLTSSMVYVTNVFIGSVFTGLSLCFSSSSGFNLFLVQAFQTSPCSFFRNTWKYGPPPYSVTLYKQKGRHYHLWSEKIQLINFIFSFEYSWTIYCYLYVHVHVHVHVCDYCCYWNSSVLIIIWFNVFFVFCLTNMCLMNVVEICEFKMWFNFDRWYLVRLSLSKEILCLEL